MLFVMDIGNTNIVSGVYKGDRLLHHWRMSTEKGRTSDELGLLLINFFNYEGIGLEDITGIIVASVVPPVMYSVEHAMRKYLKKDPLIVGPGIKTGLNIRYENPREVGADRIANAVAALELYGGPLIIVDFGTATTFCAVSSNNEYLGGVICPGIKISADALFEKTAKLPRVEIAKTETVIGKNTVNSMKAGIVYGYAGQVDYLVNRIKDEMKEKNIKVIATGGLSRLIAGESKTIERVDGLLTLEGLRIIYERNET